ncbi:hypothetical protein [uncultured Roseibium sp.]|uniref:hypothetical protein n=1 Tax=uncultured Roseibium sp. TaxID=1936171 RepID=UPI00261F93F0|nr:hypothetical protein [uncultured Roseibium sp.]
MTITPTSPQSQQQVVPSQNSISQKVNAYAKQTSAKVSDASPDTGSHAKSNKNTSNVFAEALKTSQTSTKIVDAINPTNGNVQNAVIGDAAQTKVHETSGHRADVINLEGKPATGLVATRSDKTQNWTLQPKMKGGVTDEYLRKKSFSVSAGNHIPSAKHFGNSDSSLSRLSSMQYGQLMGLLTGLNETEIPAQHRSKQGLENRFLAMVHQKFQLNESHATFGINGGHAFSDGDKYSHRWATMGRGLPGGETTTSDLIEFVDSKTHPSRSDSRNTRTIKSELHSLMKQAKKLSEKADNAISNYVTRGSHVPYRNSANSKVAMAASRAWLSVAANVSRLMMSEIQTVNGHGSSSSNSHALSSPDFRDRIAAAKRYISTVNKLTNNEAAAITYWQRYDHHMQNFSGNNAQLPAERANHESANNIFVHANHTLRTSTDQNNPNNIQDRLSYLPYLATLHSGLDKMSTVKDDNKTLMGPDIFEKPRRFVTMNRVDRNKLHAMNVGDAYTQHTVVSAVLGPGGSFAATRNGFCLEIDSDRFGAVSLMNSPPTLETKHVMLSPAYTLFLADRPYRDEHNNVIIPLTDRGPQ